MLPMPRIVRPNLIRACDPSTEITNPKLVSPLERQLVVPLSVTKNSSNYHYSREGVKFAPCRAPIFRLANVRLSDATSRS